MSNSEAAHWTNASVRRLLQQSGDRDPIEVVAERARGVVLKAMEHGWHGPPFDPFSLAAHLDVDVVARGDVADARLVMSESGARIEFNPARRPARIKFSIAHELGHLLFDDVGEQIRERHSPDPRAGDDWQLEMLCNVAASELLMPIGAFPEECIDDLSLTHLLDLRARFGVSTEAVLRRAMRLSGGAAAVFVATRRDDGTVAMDYATGSRHWNVPVRTGWVAPRESALTRVTAVGFSIDATEEWAGHELRIQAVGVPPYEGHRFPRTVGLLTPVANERISAPGITYVRGDATRPQARPGDVLVHVVNNAARTWGGHGFAAALRKAEPEVHAGYSRWATDKSPRLGAVHWSETSDGTQVASVVAQSGYGDSQQPRLRLSALDQGFQEVASFAVQNDAAIHMPLIGTGQGGAQWATVRDLIIDSVCARRVPVTVYVLPQASMPTEQTQQLSLLS